VGVTPWEGPVAPGEHSVALRPLPAPEPPSACGVVPRVMARAMARPEDKHLATVPVAVVVKPRQTIGVQLKAERLNAGLRILPTPATASIFVDGSRVSRGGFEAQLKPGEHVIKVEAEGYFAETQNINLTADDLTELQVTLRKDFNSPVWAEKPRVVLELSGGGALAPSFGGDIARGCTGDCKQAIGAGAQVAFRAGYEFSNGLSLGGAARYMGIQQSISGRPTRLLSLEDNLARDGVTNDTVSIQGFWVGPYAAYRLGKRFPVHLGLAAGVGFGSVSDRRTGLFGASAVGPVVQSGFLTWVFVEPELRVGVRVLERLTVGVNLSGMFMFAPRVPRWNEKMTINPHGNPLGLADRSAESKPGKFGTETIIGSPMVVITEGVSVRYDF